MLNPDDLKTNDQITKTCIHRAGQVIQYFLRNSSYDKQPFFDASVFEDLWNLKGQELIAEMN